LRADSFDLLENNQAFHRMLTEGIDIKFGIGGGKTKTDKVWLIDFDHPDNNEFLAVNQFTVIENNNNKRPDIVLFINGLPFWLQVKERKELSNPKININFAKMG
jgi:type I restriction enzyme R subunit